jgi:hypothetical protein
MLIITNTQIQGDNRVYVHNFTGQYTQQVGSFFYAKKFQRAEHFDYPV